MQSEAWASSQFSGIVEEVRSGETVCKRVVLTWKLPGPPPGTGRCCFCGSPLFGHLSSTDAPWSPQGPALAALGVFPPCFEGLGGTRGQSAQARVAGSCPWSPETSASDGHNQCPTAPCPGTSAVGQVGGGASSCWAGRGALECPASCSPLPRVGHQVFSSPVQ